MTGEELPGNRRAEKLFRTGIASALLVEGGVVQNSVS